MKIPTVYKFEIPFYSLPYISDSMQNSLFYIFELIVFVVRKLQTKA